jgi:hypothetical protein
VTFAALVFCRRDDRDLTDGRERLRNRQQSWRAHAIVVGQQNSIRLSGCGLS